MKKAIILSVTLSVLLLLVIGYKLVHRVEPISPIVTEETIPIETVGQSVIESQTPDVQEVTGVDEDGTISYVTSDGDSGLLESDTPSLEEAWGVSKEEMAANKKNMSEEEFIEWMMQMDEEYNQRLEEAAKKEEEAAKAETAQEVQQPQQSQQETQAEVKQPQQTQEQNNTGVTDYTVYDDGTVSWRNADGTITIDISNQIEGSVDELTDYEKEITVN